MLLPAMIRERIPDASIGFFLHIPFPPHELFRLIPRNNEILTGLLGADLIGFHTFEYLHYFLNTIRRILGYDQEMLEIISPSRRVKTDVFPMGIDVLKFQDSLDDLRVKKEIQLIRKEISQEKIILSIDRLDYTKGVPLRLKAFEKLLVDHEELRGKVTLLLVVVPSRTGIEHYTRLRDEIEHLVGKINGLFGDIWWTPIRYLYRYLPFHQLIAAYAASDLALVTPLRDGMNLIAKEYLATKPEGCGMLILSEFAGAAKELGEAIIINPSDIPEFSRAIYEGLMMSEAEMRNRITPMQQRLLRYDLHKWTSDVIASLDCAKRHQDLPSSPWMDQDSISRTCRSYHAATSRILFLDYDGTVFPLVQTPDLAKPDPEILSLLEALSHEHGTEVVIVSGRGREVLDAWFGHLPIGIIAEHGIWTKEKGNAWKMDTEVSGEWKADLIPVLETFRDRTPGSLIEEKEYALAWHFRNADPDLALVRARDLREELTLRIKNQHLILLDGHKVLEVRNAGIDKGTAVQQWYSLASYEFCFAAGDDRTDEDMFSVLPQRAFTIKVGSGPTRARLRVRSVDDVRQLLRCFSS
jgi:trehalose 6-phosphate synthase/phosphatase